MIHVTRRALERSLVTNRSWCDGAAVGMRRLRTLAAVLLAFASTCVHAGSGDITIRTEHLQYPGEGAFQTVDDCVTFATGGASGDQQEAIALYNWLLTHQWHLMSPQEWCVPGRIPDTAETRDYESIVFDANRARFSYGYGLCGTVHAWNEPYWKALGMNARRRAFPGHVNSEVLYGGTWHAFDTDMAGLLFRRDGIVAGYDDIIRDPSLIDSVKPPYPHYPFAWPSDSQVMKDGWKQVAAGGDWYRMYNSGYAAHPAIVHLRKGETFTRWFDRDHFGGRSKRRFWHHQPGGPFRNWSFFDNGEPFHDGAKHNARSDVSYCNGEFIYVPDLSTDAYREGVASSSQNLSHGSTSPLLHSEDGQQARVTFRHFSPYVICGDPVDDANPMSGAATDGLVLEAKVAGKVSVEVSANEGQSWTQVEAADNDGSTFRFDLTEHVKGRYGWQIQFRFEGASGIDSLKFTTTTQVCQAIFPQLTEGGCDVTCRITDRSVVAVLPDFGLPEANVSHYEEVSLRSANVIYQPRVNDNRLAYQTTNNKSGEVVFRVTSPKPLLEVRAAVRYQLRVPPEPDCDYHMDISTDNGTHWRRFAIAEIPADNEFSSGWLSGRSAVSSADCHEALVRVHFDGGGHRTGLMDAQLYGIHRIGNRSACVVEFGWTDDGGPQTHVERIAADRAQSQIHVPTSSDSIRNEFVRISVSD
ncbi:MAG: hypothetical protein R3C19_23385 [Planctomycetaceae bacterium]